MLLARLAEQVRLDGPWRAPKAAEWDSETVATWLNKHTHTGGAKGFFELICEGVWAAQPADLSLLHFLFYVHSGGGLDMLGLDRRRRLAATASSAASQVVAEPARRPARRSAFASSHRRCDVIAHEPGDVTVERRQPTSVTPPRTIGAVIAAPPHAGGPHRLRPPAMPRAGATS